MSIKKLFSVASLLVIASLIIGACGPAAPQAATPVVQTVVIAGTPQTVVVTATPEAVEKAKVLRINLGTYPEIIDPQKSSFVNEIGNLRMIYEGLTRLDEHLNTVPGQAESWVANADASEFTFKLRSGLKYSDGSLLNAKRFEYSLTRNIDPETAGEYGTITNEIAGAEEWQAADIAAPDYDRQAYVDALGVKALDGAGNACTDYEQADCLTLKVTLRKPAPYFPTILGIWVTFPAKEELIAEGGENWWNSSVYQIGNGPFILKTVEPFVRTYFTPNPNYWAGTPKVEVEFRYIVDTAVAFEAYKNNELDMIDLVGEDLDAVNADPDLSAQKLVYAGSCTFVIKFGLASQYTAPDGSTYDSPFLDKKVREAFAYGFDAQSWADDLDAGLSAPTQTWIPLGFPGYDPDETSWKFDPDKAKAALAESSFGSPDALNKLGLKLTFGDTPRNRQRSEWLVNNYKQVLGVDISLDPVEPTTFTALTKDPKTFPLLARQGWCADYPDPQNWLSVYWKSDTTFAKRQGYVNPDFDALVAQADVEPDAAKRADLYLQAQRLLIQDAPSAFGYNSTNSYLVKPWVKGLLLTPQDADYVGSYAPLNIDIDTSMLP